MKTLNQEDKNNLKILMNLGFSIIENENKLADLESKNLKDSAEYNNILESLKSTLLLEKSIYDKLDFTTEKIVGAFMELGNPNNFAEQINLWVRNNPSEMIKTRIINKLFNIMLNIKHGSTIKGIAINPMTKKTEMFYPENILKLEKFLKYDIFTVLLNLLNKEIDTNVNTNIRKILTERKYSLAFLNQEFEESIINQNYELIEPYLTSKAYNSFYKLSEELYENFSFQLTKCLFDVSANELAYKRDFEEENNYAEAILLKIILKTCLVLDTNNLEYSLKEQINIQTKFMHKTETAGIKMILDIISNAEEDKKLFKVVTLKLTKRES